MDLKPSAVWELANVLSVAQDDKRTTARATVSRTSSDGRIWVRLSGSDIETPVNGTSSASVEAGDGVTVTIGDGRCSITGNDTSPSAGVGMLNSVAGRLDSGIQGVQGDMRAMGDVVAGKATVRELNAAKAYIETLEADTAKIHSLEASEISAAIAYISDLNAENVLASNLTAANAFIRNLVSDDVTADDLIATNGFVESLIASNVTTVELTAASGYVGSLISDEITVDSLEAATAYVGQLEANSVTAESIEAASAYIASLVSEDVTVESLVADTAKVHALTAEQLSAATAFVGALTANSVTASDLTATNAYITALAAENVTAATLEAAAAYIAALDADGIRALDISADHATVGNLDANYAHITNGTIDNARIGYANVTDLDAHYADIGLANVDNAWIERGVLRDASVSDAKIIGVSANKLTAGTIDASRINVTNLNANNITVGTINGQRIGEGSLSLDKLSESVYTSAEIDSIVGDIDRRLDSAIETWTGSVEPSLYSYPANEWQPSQYASHVGDVYYVTNPESDADGQSYRFAYDRTTDSYRWSLIQDSAVTAALSRIMAAEGDIATLKRFDTELSRWKTATDSEVTSLMTSTTRLEAWMELAITDTMMLWKCTPTETPPQLPTQPVLNEGHAIVDESGEVVNDDEGNDVVTETTSAWTVTIPIYDPSMPYYWYTWQQRQADDTFKWTEPVYDRTVSETQRDAKSALSQLALKVDSSVFNEVKQTVDQNSATITSLSTTIATKADGSTVTTLSNLVNSVKQTADSNTASIESLTSTVDGNYSDLTEKHSELSQTLEGISSEVGSLSEAIDGNVSRLSSVETSVEQLSDSIELKASRTEVQESIADAVSVAGGVRYDHTYEQSGETYTFTASASRGNVDITTLIDPDRFVWWVRTEEGDELYARGVTMTVDASALGYRSSIIGGLEEYIDATLVDADGNAIIISTGETVLVHKGLEA